MSISTGIGIYYRFSGGRQKTAEVSYPYIDQFCLRVLEISGFNYFFWQINPEFVTRWFSNGLDIHNDGQYNHTGKQMFRKAQPYIFAILPSWSFPNLINLPQISENRVY